MPWASRCCEHRLPTGLSSALAKSGYRCQCLHFSKSSLPVSY